MYSRNDYRYYLENRLLMDENELYHHGVLGMKWGIRRYQSYSTVPRKSGEGGKETGLAKKRSKLESKKTSNNAKISQYKTELSKPKSMKQKALEDKYQRKLDKVNKSALTRGADQYSRFSGEVGVVGHIQNAKRSKYKAKLAKYAYKNDLLNSKISDLEYKNSKIDKKLKNIDTKVKLNEAKALYKDVNKGYKDAARTASKKYMNNEISTKDYDSAMDLYGKSAKLNKDLYKVEKSRIKKPDAYNESYSYIKPYMESAKGSTADDYIVTSVDRKGRVKQFHPVWTSNKNMDEVNSVLKQVVDTREKTRKSKKGK